MIGSVIGYWFILSDWPKNPDRVNPNSVQASKGHIKYDNAAWPDSSQRLIRIQIWCDRTRRLAARRRTWQICRNDAMLSGWHGSASQRKAFQRFVKSTTWSKAVWRAKPRRNNVLVNSLVCHFQNIRQCPLMLNVWKMWVGVCGCSSGSVPMLTLTVFAKCLLVWFIQLVAEVPVETAGVRKLFRAQRYIMVQTCQSGKYLAPLISDSLLVFCPDEEQTRWFISVTDTADDKDSVGD